MIYRLQYLSCPIETYSETLHMEYEKKEYNTLDDAITDVCYLEEEYGMIFHAYSYEKKS